MSKSSLSFPSSTSMGDLSADDVDIQYPEIIGRGNFGIIFSGYMKSDKDDDKKVAAKQFNSLLPSSQVKQVTDNLQKLKQLSKENHNLLGIEGFFVQAGVLTVVTEYCELGDLEKYFRKNHVDLIKAVQFMERCASAVDFLHRQSPIIVHKNVKPTNILLQRLPNKLRIKLADCDCISMSKTSAGDRSVTLQTSVYEQAFLAPEIFKQAAVGPATDVFSLGIVFLAMVNFRALDGKMIMFSADELYEGRFTPIGQHLLEAGKPKKHTKPVAVISPLDGPTIRELKHIVNDMTRARPEDRVGCGLVCKKLNEICEKLREEAVAEAKNAAKPAGAAAANGKPQENKENQESKKSNGQSSKAQSDDEEEEEVNDKPTKHRHSYFEEEEPAIRKGHYVTMSTNKTLYLMTNSWEQDIHKVVGKTGHVEDSTSEVVEVGFPGIQEFLVSPLVTTKTTYAHYKKDWSHLRFKRFDVVKFRSGLTVAQMAKMNGTYGWNPDLTQCRNLCGVVRQLNYNNDPHVDFVSGFCWVLSCDILEPAETFSSTTPISNGDLVMVIMNRDKLEKVQKRYATWDTRIEQGMGRVTFVNKVLGNNKFEIVIDEDFMLTVHRKCLRRLASMDDKVQLEVSKATSRLYANIPTPPCKCESCKDSDN